MFCTRCGTPNPEGAGFCSACNTPLVRTTPQPKAPTTTPQNPSPYAPQQPQRAQSAQPPYPGYQGYPVSNYAAPSQTPPSASGRSIASMVLSILSIAGFGPFTSIIGMILGKMEMNAIRDGKAPVAGETFAKVGFYLGLAVTILSCVGGLALAVLFFIGITIGAQ